MNVGLPFIVGYGVLHFVENLWRASLEGGALVLFAWLLARRIPRLPARVGYWLWWFACLKMLVGLTSLDTIPIKPSPPVVVRVSPLYAQEKAEFQSGSPTILPSPARASQSIEPIPSRSLFDDASPAMLIPLFLAWAIGICFFLLRTDRQLQKAKRLVKDSKPLDDSDVRKEMERICRQFGLRRPPRLLESESASGPFVTGAFRASLVLPRDIQSRLSPAELRMILAHEIAHLRRRDLSLNLVPHLARTIFFFHPLVHLAVRECALASETACDEAVLKATDSGHAEYGRLLLKLIAANPAPVAVAALGTTSNFRSVQRRFQMLPHLASFSRRGAWLGALLMAAFGAACFLTWRTPAEAAGFDTLNPPIMGSCVPEKSLQETLDELGYTVNVPREFQGHPVMGWDGYRISDADDSILAGELNATGDTAYRMLGQQALLAPNSSFGVLSGDGKKIPLLHNPDVSDKWVDAKTGPTNALGLQGETRFYLDVNDVFNQFGGGGTFGSVPALNPDGIARAILLPAITGGKWTDEGNHTGHWEDGKKTGAYLLCWEDGLDFDYQDMVVLVQGFAPL
jgi:beta-lactamase regulating signal transducer with metallopeptidase domain